MTPPAEKSTSQLAIWRELVDALDRLDAVWARTHTTGPHSASSAQLPANVAGALAKAAGRGAGVLAGISEVLADQQDTGAAYRTPAGALRQAADEWPGQR
jgi:hypothetical protein